MGKKSGCLTRFPSKKMGTNRLGSEILSTACATEGAPPGVELIGAFFPKSRSGDSTAPTPNEGVSILDQHRVQQVLGVEVVCQRLAGVNVDTRTVELSFSSEEPVARSWGVEILSHEPGAADLTRLNSGRANVLVNHNLSEWCGVIQSAYIRDRRGRALVRFGNSERAKEVFLDIVDGVLQSISVGYTILASRQVGRDPDQFLITSWVPYEISVVTAPADLSVGVGRVVDGAADARTTVAATTIAIEQRRLARARQAARAAEVQATWHRHVRMVARRNGGRVGCSFYIGGGE
jgi:phage head maturation protease